MPLTVSSASWNLYRLNMFLSFLFNAGIAFVGWTPNEYLTNKSFTVTPASSVTNAPLFDWRYYLTVPQ